MRLCIFPFFPRTLKNICNVQFTLDSTRIQPDLDLQVLPICIYKIQKSYNYRFKFTIYFKFRLENTSTTLIFFCLKFRLIVVVKGKDSPTTTSLKAGAKNTQSDRSLCVCTNCTRLPPRCGAQYYLNSAVPNVKGCDELTSPHHLVSETLLFWKN